MAGIVAIEDLAQSRVDVIDGDERDRLTGRPRRRWPARNIARVKGVSPTNASFG